MESRIINTLASDDSIDIAALLDPEGFILHRTASDFDGSSLLTVLDLRPDDESITVVGEVSTLIATRLKSGHTLVVSCPSEGNIGMARMLCSKAANELLAIL